MSVEPESVPDEVRQSIPLHVVTDCNSLHETVVKSGAPEDKRAAIEVLAIKEMLVNADDSESEVEAETLRLRERDLSKVFHWTVSEDQKGDALTKRTLKWERDEWHERASWISLRTAKKTDIAAQKMIPSRTRPRVDRSTAQMILGAHAEAATRAGF